ncbi:MAG: hypothetical protein K1000chlam2_00478 [Chlamydiae bacterium]|nr:hypothetical protein [Chlamydiota bacterium]
MRILSILLLLVASMGFAEDANIRIIPVKPTPEPNNVETTIVFPKEDQIISNPVKVQIRLVGFPVGTISDFDRKNEIYNDPHGQSMLVFIDNEHPIEIYKSFVDSLDQNNLFYYMTLNTTVPFNLKQGMHVIRAFPDRSFGESLKGSGCYDASIFYIGREEDNLDIDLDDPYLTYNEPLETLRYSSEKPILLDFYLSNVQLSRDGYKVKVTIDKDTERSLTSWVPYYVYGLEAGKHTIQLQLINEKNEVVPGLFNDVTRTITVN